MAVSPFAPPLPVCGIGGLLHDLHHGLVGGFRDFVPWAATQQLGWPFDISGRKISGKHELHVAAQQRHIEADGGGRSDREARILGGIL
jgi:hypothetical protein